MSDQVSRSGVRIAADFRSNLIIDRYDRVFTGMRVKKLEHLRSENSEDAITWNVFRSLRQIDPTVWLPPLWKAAFPQFPVPEDRIAMITLWSSVAPPPSLVVGKPEGASEIDVILETGSWVWFIEAKYKSDISTRTTTRPGRDQILRNIDVGSHYAGARPFFFSLLTISDALSPIGARTMGAYSEVAAIRDRLKDHRPDGIANLTAIGALTWVDLAQVLGVASAVAREDERHFATRALTWLKGKGIG